LEPEEAVFSFFEDSVKHPTHLLPREELKKIDDIVDAATKTAGKK
jgi:hypothetical protein